MKYGLVLSTMDTFANPDLVIELARLGETSGWSDLFFADHIMHRQRLPWLDPNIMMAAVAANTSTIKLGTWITAVPRRLPW